MRIWRLVTGDADPMRLVSLAFSIAFLRAQNAEAVLTQGVEEYQNGQY